MICGTHEQLLERSRTRPEGYYEAVMAVASREGDNLCLNQDDYAALVARFNPLSAQKDFPAYLEFARTLSGEELGPEAKAQALEAAAERFGLGIAGIQAMGDGRYLVVAHNRKTALEVGHDGVVRYGRYDSATGEALSVAPIKPLNGSETPR